MPFPSGGGTLWQVYTKTTLVPSGDQSGCSLLQSWGRGSVKNFLSPVPLAFITHRSVPTVSFSGGPSRFVSNTIFEPSGDQEGLLDRSFPVSSVSRLSLVPSAFLT